jgi:hypothetical protein
MDSSLFQRVYETESFNEVYFDVAHDLTHSTAYLSCADGQRKLDAVNPSLVITCPWDCLAAMRKYPTKDLESKLLHVVNNEANLQNLLHNGAFLRMIKRLTDDATSNAAIWALTQNDQTFYLQLLIRNGKLYCSVHENSSDFYETLPYSVALNVFVQLLALRDLRETYPELTPGSYIHTCGSLYIHEPNAPVLLSLIAAYETHQAHLERFEDAPEEIKMKAGEAYAEWDAARYTEIILPILETFEAQ